MSSSIRVIVVCVCMALNVSAYPPSEWSFTTRAGVKYSSVALKNVEGGFFYFTDYRGKQITIPALQIPEDERSRMTNAVAEIQAAKREAMLAKLKTTAPPPPGVEMKAIVVQRLSDGFISENCEVRERVAYNSRGDSPPLDDPIRIGGTVGAPTSFGPMTFTTMKWVRKPGLLVVRGIASSNLVDGEMWSGRVEAAGIETIGERNFRVFRPVE